MDLTPIWTELLKLGLTPLELITIIAVIVLYMENRALRDRMFSAETRLEKCLDPDGHLTIHRLDDS